MFGSRRKDPPRVLMVTRRDCHLCQEAWTHLQDAQREHHFLLEEQDVDSQPELAAQFGQCVPVVFVDGKVRFRGRVNPVLLKRLLRARAIKK
jgi:hypothetical protein